MTTNATTNFWSKDSLVAKAQLYVDQMNLYTSGDWQYGLFSSLSLEFLARAALANISPALLADQNNWRNVYYALGGDLTAKKFSPVSIGTKEVLARLTELLPAFTNEMAGFCSKHTERRNSELHTGEAVFVESETSEWLPRYYNACAVLLKSMDRALGSMMPDAKKAQELIDSLSDSAGKAVEQEIRAYARVWNDKSEDAKTTAKAQAEVWATRHAGHRVFCPACKTVGLLKGAGHGPVTTTVLDDSVIQKQLMLPTAFECIACKLKVAGYSKLTACGLGNPYTETTTYSAAEFFNLYTEDDMEQARLEEYRQHSFEPDNND